MDEPRDVRAFFDTVPEEDSAAERRALERLRAHIASETALRRSPGPKRHPARLLAAAGAAVLMLVTVITLVLLPARRDGPSSAAALLGRLAATAVAQADRNLQPGEYLFTRSQELRADAGTDLETGASWRFVVRVVRKSWFATNGSGRIVTSYGEPAFVSEADREAWEVAGSPPLIPADRTDETYAAGEFPSPDLARLPTDPQALRRMLIEEDREQDTEGDSVFEAVGRLLSERDASPKLRAALFEVAASLPGVVEVGVTTDPIGRPGVGVEQTTAGAPIRLVFDPSTSALLSIEHRRGQALESWVAYEESRPVSNLGA